MFCETCIAALQHRRDFIDATLWRDITPIGHVPLWLHLRPAIAIRPQVPWLMTIYQEFAREEHKSTADSEQRGPQYPSTLSSTLL